MLTKTMKNIDYQKQINQANRYTKTLNQYVLTASEGIKLPRVKDTLKYLCTALLLYDRMAKLDSKVSQIADKDEWIVFKDTWITLKNSILQIIKVATEGGE